MIEYLEWAFKMFYGEKVVSSEIELIQYCHNVLLFI